jgi:3-dehydroquinate dehydratase-1
LQRALRLRRRPDFFELRLDALFGMADKLQQAIPRLRAPIIITARAPNEGGTNNLSLARRRALLLRFLPHAAGMDVELSCARALASVLKRARQKKLCIILSLHNQRATPALSALLRLAHRAHSLGADIFKIASRTDRLDQLHGLLEFVQSESLPLPVSAMGIGKLGRSSRVLLAHAGSLLNYAHLGRATIEGQWSLARMSAELQVK